ncbi:hypothetical protein AAFX60_002580 [Aliivibrio fischeri]
MKTYVFSLTISNNIAAESQSEDDLSDALYGGGCDDSVIATYNNTFYLTFDREADNYEQAVMSAIADVEAAINLPVLSVDAGDMVGLTDAEKLSGMTKTLLSKYNKGTRGAGDFPSPIQRVNTKNAIWSWYDIADWLEANGFVEKEIVDNARVTAAINMSLQARKHHLLADVNRYTDMLKGCAVAG